MGGAYDAVGFAEEAVDLVEVEDFLHDGLRVPRLQADVELGCDVCNCRVDGVSLVI